jgi:hypothetical protein
MVYFVACATYGLVLSPAFSREAITAPQWAAPTSEEVLPGVWRVRFGTPERFTPVALQVGRDTVFQITIKAFGPSPASFTLFDDDCTSFDFESGAFNRVVLTWTPPEGGKAERKGTFSGRRYEIKQWESVRGPE